jgi:alpha-L-fucosidase 2
MKRFLTLLAALVASWSCLAAQTPNCPLWFDRPASYWEEAWPVGNGRIGAMVYGGTEVEELQLNEETISTGGPYENWNPEGLQHLQEIRDLIFAGRYDEAQKLGDAHFLSPVGEEMSYQTAGSLKIRFLGRSGEVSDYRRELDLDRAVVRTSYKVDGVEYVEEVFASLVDQLIVVRLTASRPKALSCELFYTTPMPDTKVSVVGRNLLRLEGKGSDKGSIPGAIRYVNDTRATLKGGKLSAAADKLCVEGATELLLHISLATNFVDYKTVDGDPYARNAAYMKKASRKYGKALAAHVAAYKAQFDRVRLDLGPSTAGDRPVDERIRTFRETRDPALVAAYFQFGRYLLISCSQPGTQAANLQGIWNARPTAPWCGNYTTNINLEMNYWPAELTNLPELHEPLLALIRDLAESGAVTARNMYGCRGWVLHHNSDLWRITGALDFAYCGLWPSGGAWLCQHLWDRYLYNGDKKYLAEVYPLMKGAAEFYADWVIRRGGRYLTSPSTSPENNYKDENGKVHDVMENSAMDREILSDLLGNVIEASRILKTDARSRARWRRIRAGLAPLEIGERGNIVEWDRDFADKDAHHRHISHLYALYPSNEISPSGTPELAEAARRTMEIRGETGPGWSMVWKMACYARLLDAETAHTMLRNQLCKATSPTLLDIYPPFQIDANLGALAGYTEMLLQDAYEQLHLLPAVPSGWADGSVSGMRARGGYTVDMTWRGGRLQEAVIKASSKGRCTLLTSVPVRIEGRRARTVKGASGYVTRFKTVPDGSYEVFSD